MDPTDMKRYPKGALLLRSLETTLKGKPKVRDAFLRACTEDDQTQPTKVAEDIALKKALRWAVGPRVDVHEGMIKATESGKVVDACGFQSPFGSGQLLIITSFFFDAHEFGIDEERGKNASRLTRTVLHEAVHWVRQEARASDEIAVGGFKGSYKEAGHVFEEWAYGTANICTDEELFDAMTTFSPSGEKRLLQSRKP
jgi:hypothetical protein